jgi:hypothetical protein
MKALLALVVAITIGLFAQDAFAYSYKYCGSTSNKIKWGGTSKRLYASTVSFPAGYWQNGIQNTINVMNQNPSKFRYSLSMDSGGVGRGNGQSEIWFSSSLCSPACAYQYYSCYWLFGWRYGVNEVDIVYSTSTSWTASTAKSGLIRYGGTRRALQSTGVHELGHGLILNHVNTKYNIMGTDFEHMNANGGTARTYVGEDAANGMVFLYGNRGGWQDVSVTHWKYAGTSGEYSDHTRTVIRSSGGSILPAININGETGRRVSRGTWVRAEFTFENNGSNTQTGVPVGFYISTNDYISTYDRRVATRTLTLARDNPYTSSTWVFIPSDLTRGRNYWLGAIVDYTNIKPEQVEYNNATYIPIRIN